MMIGFFCLNFVIYLFITWFPTYLVQAQGFFLKELGTLGILPALAAISAVDRRLYGLRAMDSA